MGDVAIRKDTALNYSDIANDVGVSVNTTREWFSILVSIGMVYLLETYLSNQIKRLTHMPQGITTTSQNP